jgi:hypothetical protein
MGISAGRESTLEIRVEAQGYAPVSHRFALLPNMPWPTLDLRARRIEQEDPDEDSATEGFLPDGVRGPGLISWWWKARESDGVNTTVCRGVPVTPGGHHGGLAVVDAKGGFTLAGPWKQYPLCFQRAGAPPQWFVPAAGEDGTHLAARTGAIEGRVVGLPPGAVHHVHVVLFSTGVVRLTTRLREDGSFTFREVAAKKCWLRAGDDNLERIRSKLGATLGLEDYSAAGKPWLGAVEVESQPGETVSWVEVLFE